MFPYQYWCESCGLFFEETNPITIKDQDQPIYCSVCYYDLHLSSRTEQEEAQGKAIIFHEETKDKKLHKYFITFTTKPTSKFEDVKNCFQRFTKYTSPGFKKLWYVEEHLDSNPHIHVYAECENLITRNGIKRLEKHGRIDKQRAKGNESQVMDYLGKENDIIFLI